MTSSFALLALVACGPAFLPTEDPGQSGGPVGVRTLTIEGRITEVWYPAHPRHTGDPTEVVDFAAALSPAVRERLAGLDLPGLPSSAVRDAEVHPDGPFPGIVFSHGFGGTREQSVTLTTHLASRGFVVVATNHEGRSIAELVPCMFSPPMDGCELAFDDPAPPDIDVLATWLTDPSDGFEDVVSSDGLGLFGHSAGGISTVTVGNEDARFAALAPMAGGEVVTRDDVAVQRWAGTCDGIVLASDSAEAHGQSVGGSYLTLQGAGHLAFSDLCGLDLDGLLDEIAALDDVSELFLNQARALATDGCPGAAPSEDLPECVDFLPTEQSTPVLTAELAAFFESSLLGRGRLPASESAGILMVE